MYNLPQVEPKHLIMEQKKYPHDPTMYPQLFQLSKDSFLAEDPDSLENLLHQASSLHTEGYITRREKHDISKLLRIFIESLATSATK